MTCQSADRTCSFLGKMGKHYWKFFCIFLLFGLIYRLFIFHDQHFDLIRFSLYSLVGLALIAANKVHLVVFDKRRQRWGEYDEQVLARATQVQRTKFTIVGGILGVTIPLLTGIPMLLTTTPPMMAVLGYEQFYDADKLLTDLLGLPPFTSVATKLMFLVGWFLAGSAILHLEFYLSWKHWDKMRESSPAIRES